MPWARRNCAVPMTVLNTMRPALNVFKDAVDARIASGDKKDEALLKEIQKLIKESKAIRSKATATARSGSMGRQARTVQLLDTPLAVWDRKEGQAVRRRRAPAEIAAAPRSSSRTT